MRVAIIDYGAGNIKSIQFAFKRLGVEAIPSRDRLFIKTADKVVFPGVGQASSAMQQISQSGLDVVIPNLKQPVLGICLGMQLLCDYSEEGNTEGLGVFPVSVKRFSDKLKVPKIGWNNLCGMEEGLLKSINPSHYHYFVHSYYVPVNDFTRATAYYGIQYSAVIQKDNFYACQFHPEKGGEIGKRILKNFIEL